MTTDNTASLENIVQFIKQGKIVVLPTDTVYGIHASIFLPKAIRRIYRLKGRKEKKPFIILVNEIEDIEKLGIAIPSDIKVFLKKVWPGKVSIVFPVKNSAHNYLHRGSDSLAFRIPKSKLLREIVSKTGPIISTSVNPAGLDPARSIKEALKYFGEKIDLYIDAGRRIETPSTVIAIRDGKVILLRKGSVKISLLKHLA